MSDVKATTPFAKFLGLSLRRNGAKAAGGASKRADDDKKPNPDADDEDEDERKNASVVGEDDENDKPGSKGRRAQEPDDDAEDDQDDVDAEDEDDEAGAEDDGDDDKDRRHARPQRLSELAPAKSSRMASIRAASRQLLSLRSPLACRLLPPYVCWINKLRQICGQRVAPMGYMAA